MGARGRGARKRRTVKRQAMRARNLAVAVATDDSLEAAGGAVAEVECANCGTMNDAAATHCSNCGAPLGAVPVVPVPVAPAHADAPAEFDLTALQALVAVDALRNDDAPAEEFDAAGQSCADCGHAFAMHSPDGGACMDDGCSCMSYSEMDADGDGDAAAAAEPFVFSLRPTAPTVTDEVVLDVAAALGLAPTEAPRVREALDKFRVSIGYTLDVDPGSATAATSVPSSITFAPESIVHDVTPSPEPVAPDALTTDDGPEWTAIFAPEGKLTSDGRAFAPGSIAWRELPLTLMAMIETSEGGHIGAEVAGRIDRIWRDEAAGLIRAAGVFANTEYGSLIAAGAAADPAWFEECLTASVLESLNASLVTNQTLRGVSVDLAISRYEVGPKSDWFDENGNWAPKAAEAAVEEPEEEPSLLDILFGEEAADSIAVVLEAEIGMTTVCPFPAFAEAKIAVGQSLVAGANPAIWTITTQAGFTVSRPAAGGALTASVALADAPASVPCLDCEEASEALTGWRPALAAFQAEEPDGPCPITINDDRSFTAHLALWDTCHIGIQGRCQQPPPSKTDYRFFHLGEVVCADGERVNVGTITIDTGHAASGLGRAAATSHYDDTGTVTAYVVAQDGAHGIFVSGVIPEFVPDETVELLRGAKLSGDWRKVDGHLELVAILTVNVPGFPVPRARQLVAGGELVSLVASGIPIFEDEIPPEYREKFAALAAADRFATLAAEAV